ncbi:MAG: hypothetical protein EP315_06475, partial [Gammaproteobacteria bacterium]
MNPSHNDKQTQLFEDVLTADEVTPEQLLQYAEQPDTLSDEERAFIEARIAASPALADELRVLKNFAVAAPQQTHSHSHHSHHARPSSSFLQQLSDNIGKWFGSMLIPVGAMAVIALSVALVVVMDKSELQPQHLADTDTRPIQDEIPTPDVETATPQPEPEQALASNDQPAETVVTEPEVAEDARPPE